MRYLKTRNNFERRILFESENISRKIDDIQDKASDAGLDFDDKDTQVAIATDLMDMFRDNDIAPEYKNLDMKKISDRVQSQKESKNTKNFI